MATCPDDAPAACASPAPGFASDASTIIATRCAEGCHHAGGVAANRPFGSYDQIAPYAGDVFLQLETCQMPPPASAPALTAAQRAVLFGWILCGAHDD